MNSIRFLCITACVSSFICPSTSQAQLLSPRTFEECVNELVRSANNSDYGVAQDLCRKRFPKLSATSRGRDASLVCEDLSEKAVYRINIRAGKITIPELEKVNFLTLIRTKDAISFKGSSEEKGTGRKVTIHGKLDTELGSGKLIVEYDDKKSMDYAYRFNCVETNL